MADTHREVHVPGLVLVEHEFTVPLDHADPGGRQITVFAREVVHPERRAKPLLVYLQGGPGQEAPRPTTGPAPGWLKRALQDYRVLMLDQRGTGRSTPVGDLAGLAPQAQAEYLSHFRADAIVADAELVRERLGVDRWSIFGQSFGGFCALRYLSAAPGGLREAFCTGGLPPVGYPVDDVYRATYETLRERNRRYYTRYPEDRDRIQHLLDLADDGGLRLPNGDQMSGRRLRQVGHVLGMSTGAERLHALVERAPSSPAFRHDLQAALSFNGRNPLYVLIHEACYADGTATRWSAERVMPDDFRADPTLLTGEHVFSWMLDEDHELAPLRAAADILADWDWPPLYDVGALTACDVSCAAAIYADDAYVPRVFSEQTAALIPTMRPWVTNEYEHDGIGVDGDRILDRLIALARGLV